MTLFQRYPRFVIQLLTKNKFLLISLFGGLFSDNVKGTVEAAVAYFKLCLEGFEASLQRLVKTGCLRAEM
jgi:hypothetical protein